MQQLDKNMSSLRSWLAHIETELSRPIVYDSCDDKEIQRKLNQQQASGTTHRAALLHHPTKMQCRVTNRLVTIELPIDDTIRYDTFLLSLCTEIHSACLGAPLHRLNIQHTLNTSTDTTKQQLGQCMSHPLRFKSHLLTQIFCFCSKID